MKKKIFPYYILVTVLITTFFFLEGCHSSKVDKSLREQRLTDSITIVHLQQAILLNGDALNVQMRKEFMVTDKAGKVLSLGSLIKEKKIVYKFSENNCMACVEKYIPYLNQFLKRYGRDKIIIIGSFSKAENLFLILKNHNLSNIPVYNLSPSYLRNEKIEVINIPYVFVINPDFEISDIFIPQKEVPQLSAYYAENLVLN